MWRRVLMVVVFAAVALAGCGVRGATTTGGRAPEGPLSPSYASCPPRDRHKPGSTAPGASTVLVPGHPEAVLLCRYSGLDNPRRYALVARQLVTARPTVTRLAHELDTLRKFPRGSAFSCPNDVGTAALAFFRYARGPDDPVTIELSGCEGVSNGHVGRLAGAQGSPLVAQVERLLAK